jgi:uncharacterized membrane protein YeiH
VSSPRRRFGLSDPVAVADIAGTFLFALEGALAAIQASLDLLGIIVVGFVAALGGGILRDVLLGAVPPAATRDQRYPVATGAGAVLAMLAVSEMPEVPPIWLTGLDAAGLALFAVAGAQKAIAYDIRPIGAVILGTLTAVGGGAVRDVLLARVPVVLHSDFYATAAIFGCVVLITARRAGLSMRYAAILGGIACFVSRMLGAWNHWSLPVLQ